MSSTYQIQIVLLQKSRYDVRAECERHATIVRQPPIDAFIRIRPEEVTKNTFVKEKISISAPMADLAIIITYRHLGRPSASPCAESGPLIAGRGLALRASPISSC